MVKKCPKCGHQIEDDLALFCNRCGVKMTELFASGLIRCNNCGAKIPDPQSLFCNKCGESLKKGTNENSQDFENPKHNNVNLQGDSQYTTYEWGRLKYAPTLADRRHICPFCEGDNTYEQPRKDNRRCISCGRTFGGPD